MTSIEPALRDGRVADERMQHIRALFQQQPVRKKDAWPSQIIREAIRFVHEDGKREVKFPLMHKLRVIFRQS